VSKHIRLHPAFLLSSKPNLIRKKETKTLHQAPHAMRLSRNRTRRHQGRSTLVGADSDGGAWLREKDPWLNALGSFALLLWNGNRSR
jgi:hypothetical protein